VQISANFTLSEWSRSQLAARRGINNMIPESAIEAIFEMTRDVLQPVRDHFKKPVFISSGYRCTVLNTAVGGAKGSQHQARDRDCAADFEVFGVPNEELARWIRDNCPHDQLILEFYDPAKGPNSGWVHCSYRLPEDRNRRQFFGVTT